MVANMHLAVFAALLLACGTARAASFDCAKAARPVEKLICADPRLSEWDSKAAATYGEALSVAPSQDALRREQRNWLSATRDRSRGVDALLQAYRDREAVLRAHIEAYRFRQTTVDAAEAARSCVRFPDAEGPCKITQSGLVANAPGPVLTYQIQSYANADGPETRGIVVLAAASEGKLHPLGWLGAPGSSYDAPIVVTHAGTTLLYLPGSADGTGAFPDDALFVWHDMAWEDVDITSWLVDLGNRLPKGLTANKGIYPSWDTMTATTYLWRPSDGNCCPSGGSARLKLRLDGERIALDSVTVLKTPPP